MTNNLHRALGATTAAAIAALTLGAVAPATATSLAVEVIPTGSTASPTDVGADARFDLTLRVRDVGPVTLSVLPLQSADTVPVQQAVTAECTPASLPGVGTYDVTCEGSTASKHLLAPGEYDLTGQLLVTRDADGHVLSDTYLVHRLVVAAPAAPVTPAEPTPAPTDESPTGESPEVSAPTAPGGETPVEPDPAAAPPDEHPVDGEPGTPAIPTPPVDPRADVSGPTGTRPAGNPGDIVALTIDAGGTYEPGNTELTSDVPLSQPLLRTAACIAAGIALLRALLKRPETR